MSRLRISADDRCHVLLTILPVVPGRMGQPMRDGTVLAGLLALLLIAVGTLTTRAIQEALTVAETILLV